MKKSDNVILKINGDDYFISLKGATAVMEALNTAIALREDWTLRMQFGYKAPSMQISNVDGEKPVQVFEKEEEADFVRFKTVMEAAKQLAQSNDMPFTVQDFHEWKKEQEGL